MSTFLEYAAQKSAYDTRNALGLPPIRGQWFFVDPKNGDDTLNDGSSPALPLKTLKAAYTACTDGAGDGIAFLAITSSTTTYSDEILAGWAWSKWGITVYGLAAGGYNSRARITTHQVATVAVSVTVVAATQTITRAADSFITDGWKVGMTGIFDTAGGGANQDLPFTVTAVSALVLTGTVGTDGLQNQSGRTSTLRGYFPYLIDVSGSNNRFYNMYFINEASHVLNLGCVSVSADRNLFEKCHFNNVGTLQAADAGLYDLRLSSSECQFERCWFGNNNTARSQSSGNILLGLSTTAIGQDFFSDCYILSTSTTSGHGGIKLADAATLGGWVQFKRCSFVNWLSGALTALTTVVIGATSNNCGILLQDCAVVGWAAWAVASVHKTYVTAATNTVGTGGIGTTPA